MDFVGKKFLWGRKVLTVRNEVNQSETHLLDNSHCWNFNAGIKKFDFPMLSYIMTVTFPIEFFCTKTKFTLYLQGNMRLNIHLKQFQNRFWNSRAIKFLMDQSKFLTIFSCCPIQLWDFRCRLPWVKTSPLWGRSLTLRYEFNQPGMHWLDV